MARRNRRARIAVFFFFVATILAFRAIRDVWFGVLAAIFALAPPEQETGVHSVRESPFVVATAVAVTLLGMLVIGRSYPLSNAELWKDTADEFPVAAVEYVKRNGLTGPLYNDWNWGGFLTWTLPQVPVYVDSRTNLSGDETLERSIVVWSGTKDWASDPTLASAGLVIANPDNALTSLLHFDPRFRVSYEDARAVVFVAAKP